MIINYLKMKINELPPQEIKKRIENCPINYAISKIGGKWKPIILHRIKIGINRFGILHKSIPTISKQMLTTQLRELENDGFITRKIYTQIPPKVEYFITENGVSIFAVLDALELWGRTQLKNTE